MNLKECQSELCRGLGHYYHHELVARCKRTSIRADKSKTKAFAVLLILPSLLTAESSALTFSSKTSLFTSKHHHDCHRAAWKQQSSDTIVVRQSAAAAPTPLFCATLMENTDHEQQKKYSTKEETPSTKGAIAMGLSELAQELGGLGRARLVWDYYSIGVEPALFFSNQATSQQQQQEGHAESDQEIRKLIPSSRRSQSLGKEALNKLAALYKTTGGQLEGGVASLSHINTSSDSTTKLLLKLKDGLEIETVIIPWNGVRSTLCMSTQVGCRQGCTFCATGRMGLSRSLTCEEILAQMFFANKICRLHQLPPVTNIVFMGMGESSDNAEAVVQATRILTTRELFQLAATKVTISTVAPTPESFKSFRDAPCVLAWSVHAADDALRRKLVPTTKYSMRELRQGLIDALLERPSALRTTMLEVALMAGVNDSLHEADMLAEFAKVIMDQVPGCKLIVNLIPFNDIGHIMYQKPRQEAVVAFQRRLWAQGIFAHVRTTRGDDESAACGQLTTKRRQQQQQMMPSKS